MPIASGAAGRVDVGGDASATWSPDELKRKSKPAYKSRDSYLQRYEELKQSKNKSKALPAMTENTAQSHLEIDGAKAGSPLRNGGSEGQVSGTTSSGESFKKSQLCVLL